MSSTRSDTRPDKKQPTKPHRCANVCVSVRFRYTKSGSDTAFDPLFYLKMGSFNIGPNRRDLALRCRQPRRWRLPGGSPPALLRYANRSRTQTERRTPWPSASPQPSGRPDTGCPGRGRSTHLHQTPPPDRPPCGSTPAAAPGPYSGQRGYSALRPLPEQTDGR